MPLSDASLDVGVVRVRARVTGNLQRDGGGRRGAFVKSK